LNEDPQPNNPTPGWLWIVTLLLLALALVALFTGAGLLQQMP
jgi:hypothetical protein